MSIIIDEVRGEVMPERQGDRDAAARPAATAEPPPEVAFEEYLWKLRAYERRLARLAAD